MQLVDDEGHAVRSELVRGQVEIGDDLVLTYERADVDAADETELLAREVERFGAYTPSVPPL